MTRQPFRLQPFPADDALPALSLQGNVLRRRGQLQLGYHLQAPLDRLVLPEAAERPQRMDDLWRSCLLYTSPSPRDATLPRMPSSA